MKKVKQEIFEFWTTRKQLSFISVWRGQTANEQKQNTENRMKKEVNMK